MHSFAVAAGQDFEPQSHDILAPQVELPPLQLTKAPPRITSALCSPTAIVASAMKI
jgi:hypothetical protein